MKLTNFGESKKNKEYLPPELQGKSFRKENFMQNLLFQAGVLLLKMVIGSDYGLDSSNNQSFYEFLNSKDVK